MMGNDVWSEADLNNYVRALVGSGVSADRQQELRTIMIGHISRMRPATASEMAEIEEVKVLTENAGLALVQARLDMILLQEVLDLEPSLLRLRQPLVILDSTTPTGNSDLVEIDLAERAAAQLALDSASPEATELLNTRNPTEMPT
jgi:hypothetical protein